MDLVEALEFALSKEKEAINMYEKFSEKYPVVKDIFMFLIEEEQKHRKLIEKKLVELRNK